MMDFSTNRQGRRKRARISRGEMEYRGAKAYTTSRFKTRRNKSGKAKRLVGPDQINHMGFNAEYGRNNGHHTIH